MNISLERDVLAWLKDPLPALALIAHPANDRVVRDSGGFHVLDAATGRVHSLRGLTTPLAECFWPNAGRAYHSGGTRGQEKKKKKKKTKHAGLRRVLPLESAKPKTRVQAAAVAHAKATSAQAACRGVVRGSLIHRQAEDLFTLDAASFHRRNAHGAHPWAVRLFSSCLERGWRPAAVEFVVFDEALGIATAVDQVWLDQGGTVHLVEVKTGYSSEEAWTGATGRMRAPLNALADSAANRAIVQVMLTAMLTVNGGHAYDGPLVCWVAHIDDAHIEFLRLDPAFLAHYGVLAYQTLAKHQARRARRKAEERVAAARQKKKQ